MLDPLISDLIIRSHSFLLPTRWGGCCCGNNGVTFDMPYDIPRCMQESLVNTDDRFLWDAHTQIHLIFPVNLNFFELFPQHKHRHRAKQVLQKGLLLCKSCLCHSLGCVCLRVNMCAKGSVELSASVILRVNQVVGRGGTVQADIGLICLGKSGLLCLWVQTSVGQRGLDRRHHRKNNSKIRNHPSCSFTHSPGRQLSGLKESCSQHNQLSL